MFFSDFSDKVDLKRLIFLFFSIISCGVDSGYFGCLIDWVT